MHKVSIRRQRRQQKPLPGPAARADTVHADAHVARESLTHYLAEHEDPKRLKTAGIFALLTHFLLFFVVIPTAKVEPIRLDQRSAAIVVKRFKPPAPPSKARKTMRKKPVNPIPIPDPTPHEPEPIIEEESSVDIGEPSTDFVVGLPDGPPGPPGARAGAVGMGEGGLIAPILVDQVLPEYTPQATRAGIQGDVYIEAVVTIEGNVVEPKLIRGLPDEELNERAMEAILRWRFKPGIKDGQPVPVIALFTVTFRIH